MHWLRRLFARSEAVPAQHIRWVVLDCESSGLDPGVDQLLSIGAVALDKQRVAIDGGFSVVLRQARPSDASNIAIHGITGGAQIAGSEPGEALRAFAEFAGQAPLVAFHAPFDKALLRRAARIAGVRMPNAWLDLAELAPVLLPQKATRCRALDDWLDCFGIDHPARHDPLGDAFATAQLFQVLLSIAGQQNMRSAKELFQAAASRRWLVP